ncbi:hypothetical protein ACJX0J_031030, partial [Zea mays]
MSLIFCFLLFQIEGLFKLRDFHRNSEIIQFYLINFDVLNILFSIIPNSGIVWLDSYSINFYVLDILGIVWLPVRFSKSKATDVDLVKIYFTLLDVPTLSNISSLMWHILIYLVIQHKIIITNIYFTQIKYKSMVDFKKVIEKINDQLTLRACASDMYSSYMFGVSPDRVLKEFQKLGVGVNQTCLVPPIVLRGSDKV